MEKCQWKNGAIGSKSHFTAIDVETDGKWSTNGGVFRIHDAEKHVVHNPGICSIGLFMKA